MPAMLLGAESEDLCTALSRVVDRVSQPLALCSGAGRVLHENPALTRALEGDDATELRQAIRRVALSAGARRFLREDGASPVDVWESTSRWRVTGGRIAGPEPSGDEPGILISLEPRGDEPLPAGLLHKRYGLTPREMEVLELLRERQSNPEIADVLGISTHTARHHTEHVLLKLGLSSRRLVAARCAELLADAGEPSARGVQSADGPRGS